MSQNDFTSIKAQLEAAMATLMPGAEAFHEGGFPEQDWFQSTYLDRESDYLEIYVTCDLTADTLQLNVHQHIPTFVPANASSAEIVAAVEAARPRPGGDRALRLGD